MIQKEVQLHIDLEARQVALFVQIANQFNSKVYIHFNNLKINAKSIMGMMSVGGAKGESMNLIVEGEDEEQAVISLENFLSGKESL